MSEYLIVLFILFFLIITGRIKAILGAQHFLFI